MEQSNSFPANDQISTEQFVELLPQLVATDSPTQRMLLAHYHSANHEATRNLLAYVSGYSESYINMSYGSLAKDLAQRFGYNLPSSEYVWTSFIGECVGWRDGQAYIWKMHPQLVQAIEQLGWHEIRLSSS